MAFNKPAPVIVQVETDSDYSIRMTRVYKGLQVAYIMMAILITLVTVDIIEGHNTRAQLLKVSEQVNDCLEPSGTCAQVNVTVAQARGSAVVRCIKILPSTATKIETLECIIREGSP